MENRGRMDLPTLDFDFWKPRRRTRQADRTRMCPMISVIVPAHNEADYLPATLAALKRQNHANFEVIVVANGCSDRTAESARGNCQRVIVLSEKNLGMARNLGARLARGRILLF